MEMKCIMDALEDENEDESAPEMISLLLLC